MAHGSSIPCPTIPTKVSAPPLRPPAAILVEVSSAFPVLAALLGLLAPDPEWEPVTETTATAWAKAGGRSWTLCGELARQAAAVPSRGEGRSGRDPEGAWRARAQRCPNVPEILVLAASMEILRSVEILDGVDRPETIERRAAKHVEVLERALRWFERAAVESDRRRSPAPPETRYRRAYVLLALGRVDEARVGLADAVRHGEVERWRSDRMRAIMELLSGNLRRALQLAHRAELDAPGSGTNQRPISRYVLALVLDRSGAPHEAARLLQRLRRGTQDDSSRTAVESMLPLHERLYLRALAHQANREVASAELLWKAYLARPEPLEPERVLAERHLRELKPVPPPTGE